MRSTAQIVEAAKAVDLATQLELRYAVVALDTMLARFLRLSDDMIRGGLPMQPYHLGRLADQVAIQARQVAMDVDAYLGPEYMPGTPENVAFRESNRQFADAARLRFEAVRAAETAAIDAGPVARTEEAGDRAMDQAYLAARAAEPPAAPPEG